jgi:site-specific DNA-methyltransferase (adenine-specific)
VVLQKSPLKAKATWRSHAIPDRWLEKVDRTTHPHVKPIGLINALIEAITIPGELVVDPAAGSFVVLRAAHQLGREFIGCDIAYVESNSAERRAEIMHRKPRTVAEQPQLRLPM